MSAPLIRRASGFRSLVIFVVALFLGTVPSVLTAQPVAALSEPVVTNLGLTVGTGSCSLGVSIDSTGGQTLKSRGIAIRQQGAASWTPHPYYNNKDSIYSLRIEGLAARTNYEVTGYVTYESGGYLRYTYATPKTFMSRGPVLVDSLAVGALTQTGATFTARIVDDGNAPPITYRRFHIKSLDGTLKTAVSDYVNQIGSFSLSFSRFLPDTEYEVYAEVMNGFGLATTKPIRFRTKPEVPSVSTTSFALLLSESDLLFKSTMRGTVLDDHGSAVTDRGFVYGFSSQPTLSNSLVIRLGAGTEKFSATATGLSRGVVYYYRAYAKNAGGTGYGEIYTFKYHVAGATPTPTPLASPTPIPSSTPTPEPSSTPTPTAAPTPTPAATVTSGAIASPEPTDPDATGEAPTPTSLAPTSGTTEAPSPFSPSSTAAATPDASPSPTPSTPSDDAASPFPWAAIPIALVVLGAGGGGLFAMRNARRKRRSGG